jgi:hypothetical protein
VGRIRREPTPIRPDAAHFPTNVTRPLHEAHAGGFIVHGSVDQPVVDCKRASVLRCRL